MLGSLKTRLRNSHMTISVHSQLQARKFDLPANKADRVFLFSWIFTTERFNIDYLSYV